jgi:spermidine/putrescine transport system substrate-binding protein
MEENDDVAYAVPQEGVSLPCDELAIPAGARQAELAHAFINYLHDPRVAAENTEFAFLLCPNLASYPLLPDEIRDDATIFLPAGILRNSEVVRDLGADNAKYARLWTEIIQATPGD